MSLYPGVPDGRERAAPEMQERRWQPPVDFWGAKMISQVSFQQQGTTMPAAYCNPHKWFHFKILPSRVPWSPSLVEHCLIPSSHFILHFFSEFRTYQVSNFSGLKPVFYIIYFIFSNSHFNWIIVCLACCVNFRWTAKCFVIHTYLYLLFSNFFTL